MLPRLFAVAVTAFIAAVAPSTATAAVLLLTPPTQSVSPGDAVVLTVQIQDVSDLVAYQFEVTFDSAVLAASSVSDGGFIAGADFIPGDIDNALGIISLTAASLIGPGPGASGSGALVSIFFTAIAAGQSAVSLQNALLLDSVFDDITFTSASAAVSVTGDGGPPVPEPSAAALLLPALGMLFMRVWAGRKNAQMPATVRWS
jgi:general secretion pathway protein D